jgi:UDP-N-acetylmuramoylalanine--D-glutamate ligase
MSGLAEVQPVASSEFSVAGQRTVVVGGGRSGVPAARLLARRGARVTLADERDELAEAPALVGEGVAVELGRHRRETFVSADLIVVSPGVSLRQPDVRAAIEAGVPVMGELELASRWLRGRVIAITGTKGKSTTTTLIGRMCQQAGLDALVAGNIGTALSEHVERSTPDTLHIVEVSSFQLESTSRFHPWIAVLLNLSADHLDRHHDYAEYRDAKARIFANQGAGDWAVVNADDPEALAVGSSARARRVLCSTTDRADAVVGVVGGQIVARAAAGVTPLVPLQAIRLLGPHLRADVVAASAAAWLAGVPAEAMTAAVESFTGLEHALEPAGEVGGVRFVNDSKATNVEAARQAVLSFDAGLVPIMGGRFKGGSLEPLLEPLAARAAAVVLIGESRPAFRAALGRRVPVAEAESMSDAVRTAYALAPPGGAVLLAPACASFDMFRDYAERGRAFKAEVARLVEELRMTREQ